MPFLKYFQAHLAALEQQRDWLKRGDGGAVRAKASSFNHLHSRKWMAVRCMSAARGGERRPQKMRVQSFRKPAGTTTGSEAKARRRFGERLTCDLFLAPLTGIDPPEGSWRGGLESTARVRDIWKSLAQLAG